MLPSVVLLLVVVGAAALVLGLVRAHRRREEALRRAIARLAEIS